jgi:hypothetical protein
MQVDMRVWLGFHSILSKIARYSFGVRPSTSIVVTCITVHASM